MASLKWVLRTRLPRFVCNLNALVCDLNALVCDLNGICRFFFVCVRASCRCICTSLIHSWT
jgi:hypothetical protein